MISRRVGVSIAANAFLISARLRDEARKNNWLFIPLKVPPGSLAGGKLRLKGRGIPGASPGDFYAVLQPVLPPADSEAAAA